MHELHSMYIVKNRFYKLLKNYMVQLFEIKLFG